MAEVLRPCFVVRYSLYARSNNSAGISTDVTEIRI